MFIIISHAAYYEKDRKVKDSIRYQITPYDTKKCPHSHVNSLLCINLGLFFYFKHQISPDFPKLVEFIIRIKLCRKIAVDPRKICLIEKKSYP